VVPPYATVGVAVDTKNESVLEVYPFPLYWSVLFGNSKYIIPLAINASFIIIVIVSVAVAPLIIELDEKVTAKHIKL